MRKRPLCIAAILLLLLLWIFPKDVWYKIPDIPSGETLKITGKVIKREQKEEKFVYYLKNCHCDNSDSKFSVLAYTSKGDSYPVGCELSLYGTIYQLEEATNPGQFDGKDYYQSQGILYTFQSEAVLGCFGEADVRERLTKIREALSEQLTKIYEERDAGILKAVLLGDKSSLREEDQLLYEKNGISHILAISGLHISMIGISFYKLLRKCNLTFVEAGIPSGMLLLCYGTMTGFGVSVVRAVCMFLVMIFADIFGRVYDMASGMALAAILVLVGNPLKAWQAGFLLSFGAVVGICVVYPILQSVICTEKKMIQTILFGISIFLTTYPINVHFFYEYPLYSMAFNLIVIPCMPVVMCFGMGGLAAGFFSPFLGKIVGLPAHLILSFYENLGKGVIRLPGSVISLGREESWQLAGYYGALILGLLLLWYGRRKIYAMCLLLAVCLISVRVESPIEFTMLDVGQGDALYLELPGEVTCLIDGGSTSIKSIGKYRILPYLKYEGVDTLDYIIFTHLDEDHINGIREMVEMTDSYDGVAIRQMLFPAIENPDENYKKMWELARSKGIRVEVIGAGDVIRGKDWEMTCLYPEKGCHTTDKNEASTALQLKFLEFSMLFTGDLGLDGEKELLDGGMLQTADIWKVSHHGSKYSGGAEFLRNIHPQLSLISVGKNSYGHPARELLERLQEAGSLVKTTLDCGALQIESDGHTVSLFSGR